MNWPTTKWIGCILERSQTELIWKHLLSYVDSFVLCNEAAKATENLGIFIPQTQSHLNIDTHLPLSSALLPSSWRAGCRPAPPPRSCFRRRGLQALRTASAGQHFTKPCHLPATQCVTQLLNLYAKILKWGQNTIIFFINFNLSKHLNKAYNRKITWIWECCI